jgi:hypothetical protein
VPFQFISIIYLFMCLWRGLLVYRVKGKKGGNSLIWGPTLQEGWWWRRCCWRAWHEVVLCTVASFFGDGPHWTGPFMYFGVKAKAHYLQNCKVPHLCKVPWDAGPYMYYVQCSVLVTWVLLFCHPRCHPFISKKLFYYNCPSSYYLGGFYQCFF